MVRHMARVEQSWFRRVIEGRTDIMRFFQDEDGGFEFDIAVVDDAFVAEAWKLWRAEVTHAREVLERTGLATPTRRARTTRATSSARWSRS
jgi:hypothetical protein